MLMIILLVHFNLLTINWTPIFWFSVAYMTGSCPHFAVIQTIVSDSRRDSRGITLNYYFWFFFQS